MVYIMRNTIKSVLGDRVVMLKYICALFLLPDVACVDDKQTCNFKYSINVRNDICKLEQSMVHFNFSLKDTLCWRDGITVIEIMRKDFPECTFLQSNVCERSTSTTSCECIDNGNYLFNKTMNLSDEGRWNWSVTRGNVIIAEASLTFVIKKRAKVTSLEVNGNKSSLHILSSSKTVGVVCSWENGCPDDIARLQDNNGNVLATGANGTLAYTFPPIDYCNKIDIVCEVDGSERNITTSLQTQCPPTFVSSSKQIVKSTSIAVFKIISHTNITECRLYKLNNIDLNLTLVDDTLSVDNVCDQNVTSHRMDCMVSMDDTQHKAKCFCGINGSFPDLELSLSFYNITDQDGGNTILLLFNSDGCDSIPFTLQVSEESLITTTELPALINTDKIRVITLGIMASTALVAVLIIGIFVMLSKTDKSKRVDLNGIHQDRSSRECTINGLYTRTDEPVSTLTQDSTGVLVRQESREGEMYVYSRPLKNKREQPTANSFQKDLEQSQAYNNPYYDIVSENEDIVMANSISRAEQSVLEYANPFYEAITCKLGGRELNCDSGHVDTSAIYSNNHAINREFSLVIIRDSNNTSKTTNLPLQTNPVIHIRGLAEAQHVNYMCVSAECQGTGMEKVSRIPKFVVQE